MVWERGKPVTLREHAIQQLQRWSLPLTRPREPPTNDIKFLQVCLVKEGSEPPHASSI
jgi:hypothetical protein